MEGDNDDMLDALAMKPRSKPTKTGEHDGTVLLGDAPSVRQGRGWLRDHLRRLVSGGGVHLVELSLPQYGAAIKSGPPEKRVSNRCA